MLDTLDRKGHRPQVIQVDHGSEFTAVAMELWCHHHGVALDFICPGKPTENTFTESFNRTFRRECLSQKGILDLADTKRRLGIGRGGYNQMRPDTSLIRLLPYDFAAMIFRVSKEDNEQTLRYPRYQVDPILVAAQMEMMMRESAIFLCQFSGSREKTVDVLRR